MNLSGWEFDFAGLPNWDNRETFLDCKDYLIESPDAAYACLLYSVTEASMMNYIGFCAVLENKNAPSLLINIRYVNFEPYAKFSRDGRILFLKAHYRYGKRFILILNVEKKTYAVAHFCAPVWYEIQESDAATFEIVFDPKQAREDRRIARIKNTVIDLHTLKWRKWRPLAEGGELHLQTGGRWRDRFKSPDQIWAETLDLVISQQIAVQEFVDLNRKKTLYHFVPFTQREDGKWCSNAMKNDQCPGEYLPVFTTLEACAEYLKMNGMQHVIFKSDLKGVMAKLDATPYTHNWGVVIDPWGDYIGIPPGVRITPKSLRY